MSLVAPTIRDGGVNCVYVVCVCVCVWYVASMTNSLKMCLATLHLSPETECLIEKKLIDAPHPPPNLIPPITTGCGISQQAPSIRAQRGLFDVSLLARVHDCRNHD